MPPIITKTSIIHPLTALPIEEPVAVNLREGATAASIHEELERVLNEVGLNARRFEVEVNPDERREFRLNVAAHRNLIAGQSHAARLLADRARDGLHAAEQEYQEELGRLRQMRDIEGLDTRQVMAKRDARDAAKQLAIDENTDTVRCFMMEILINQANFTLTKRRVELGEIVLPEAVQNIVREVDANLQNHVANAWNYVGAAVFASIERNIDVILAARRGICEVFEQASRAEARANFVIERGR